MGLFCRQAWPNCLLDCVRDPPATKMPKSLVLAGQVLTGVWGGCTHSVHVVWASQMAQFRWCLLTRLEAEGHQLLSSEIEHVTYAVHIAVFER